MLELESRASILSQQLQFPLKLQHGVETTLGQVPLAQLVEGRLPVLHGLPLLVLCYTKHSEGVGDHLPQEQVPGCRIKVSHVAELTLKSNNIIPHSPHNIFCWTIL